MGIIARHHSRVAGLLYLLVVVTGIFCLAYVPSRIVVANDPTATLVNIAAHESLYRQGIAAFMIMETAFLLLGLAFYRHFRPFGPQASRIMAVLVVVSVPLALMALTHRLNVLALLTDPELAQALNARERRAAALVAMKAYGDGLLVTKLFWGLWLFPLGYLIVRTKAIPRLLGALLMLGCAGYLVDVFAGLLLPGYADSALAAYARLPASIGEIGTCLWLLLAGIRLPAGRMDGQAAEAV